VPEIVAERVGLSSSSLESRLGCAKRESHHPIIASLTPRRQPGPRSPRPRSTINQHRPPHQRVSARLLPSTHSATSAAIIVYRTAPGPAPAQDTSGFAFASRRCVAP
jgi:hypothetical protein